MLPENLINAENFEKEVDGKRISLFTISNANGFTVQIMNYGAGLVSLYCPDHTGKFEDVLLGFKDIDGYLGDQCYHGVVVGRYANRIANGIFKLDGVTYQLATNNNGNALHGGMQGFGKVVWDAFQHENSVTLYHKSKDGEEGYPGTLETRVKYTVTSSNELIIDYKASTDKKTIVNLTNHAYFNLNGKLRGSIADHQLKLYASEFTPKHENGIPTGTIESVDQSPFDFRDFKAIGKEINERHPQMDIGLGYDHNFVLTAYNGKLRKAAEVYEPNSKRLMELYTTMPGLQLYTGDYIGGDYKGKHDIVFKPRDGFCLETQFYPDSPNQTSFPSAILMPNQTFNHQSVFKFGLKS